MNPLQYMFTIMYILWMGKLRHEEVRKVAELGFEPRQSSTFQNWQLASVS